MEIRSSKKKRGKRNNAEAQAKHGETKRDYAAAMRWIKSTAPLWIPAPMVKASRG